MTTNEPVSSKPTERFANRVDHYVRYRPRYPQAIVDFLRTAVGLATDAVVADIGSGTGFLSELFLQNGNRVLGVEPNAEMRAAGDALLADYPRFESADGTAEATGLPEQSVDWVTAGQAFHWFDPPRARAEFVRILRPGGHVVLVWNSRDPSTAFMHAYEETLRQHLPEYGGVSEQNFDDEAIRQFFAPAPMEMQLFPNAQRFDLEGLRGRLRSSSYTPVPGHPSYDPLMAAVGKLFDKHQEDGRVSFSYVTRLYYGRL